MMILDAIEMVAPNMIDRDVCLQLLLMSMYSDMEAVPHSYIMVLIAYFVNHVWLVGKLYRLRLIPVNFVLHIIKRIRKK